MYVAKHSSNRALVTHTNTFTPDRNRSSVKYATKHSVNVAVLAHTNALTCLEIRMSWKDFRRLKLLSTATMHVTR